MILIPDWRRVLRKAWCIRFALIAAALGGADLLMQLITPSHPSGRFIVLAVLVNCAGVFARLVPQPKMRDDDER
jgi:hypothetical protein